MGRKVPENTNIIAHIKSKIDDTLYSFVVPEWEYTDGSDFIIYHRTLKAKDVKDIQLWMASKGSKGSEVAHALYAIQRFALDKNGDPIFSITDEEILKKCDANVIAKICGNILGGKNTESEMEKN